ncbi:putative diphthamide synthesis protein-domain-containing protein [Boletus reticuloceps]|uniref:2-(3-amino-3-carboxypropyl)histidine synthase subunit 2 n=1 Tax=Boletus reticuloceps TaxID=495285 RepID=A0A8I2YIR5_9AGAM|nr:putative diphthamide synthesis protein-domain-containing protein [Boletus reticuloceps]
MSQTRMSAEQPPSTAFAASGEEAITRSIDITSSVSAQRLESTSVAEFYEIERTAEIIVKGDYKRVALQFPDDLLHDAVPVYRLLKRNVGQAHDLYVLADTSYGNCCVDEVAAQHVDADLMVHYGHACMSKTSRLPVVYIFGRKPIDAEDCVQQLSQIFASVPDAGETVTKTVLVRHEVGYTYQAGDIVKLLRDKIGLSILYHEIPTWVDPAPVLNPLEPGNETEAPASSDSQSRIDEDANIILYIGEESLTLTNLLMTHSSSQVYSYNPITKSSRLESERTNRLLMRRFAAVQKARDADVFGILVGTLGVASYLPLVSHLRKILVKAQKKSYTISVGKLNPAKLGNFMEIECFVLAACPENSVIESKEFYRPIITPYELEVALQAEGTWSGRYVLDFGRLLAEYGSRNDTLNEQEDRDPDQPTFSLITGKYRHARRFGAPGLSDGDTSSPDTLVLRNQDGTMTVLPGSAAGAWRTMQACFVLISHALSDSAVPAIPIFPRFGSESGRKYAEYTGTGS